MTERGFGLTAPKSLAWMSLALLPLALMGCAARTTVVVLPEQDGKVGTVVLQSADGKAEINQAYASAAVARGTAPAASQSNAAQVQSQFGAALKAQPQRPQSYLLYFTEGSDTPTPESKPALDAMLADVTQRAAPEITVIGHTDRVGGLDANDQLSRQRAERVRAELVRLGVSDKLISVAGRGEREPLVPTADEVAEQKNRRVEINVR